MIGIFGFSWFLTLSYVSGCPPPEADTYYSDANGQKILCYTICPPTKTTDSNLIFCHDNCPKFFSCLQSLMPSCHHSPSKDNCSDTDYFHRDQGFCSCTELCSSNDVECKGKCPNYYVRCVANESFVSSTTTSASALKTVIAVAVKDLTSASSLSVSVTTTLMDTPGSATIVIVVVTIFLLIFVIIVLLLVHRRLKLSSYKDPNKYPVHQAPQEPPQNHPNKYPVHQAPQEPPQNPDGEEMVEMQPKKPIEESGDPVAETQALTAGHSDAVGV